MKKEMSIIQNDFKGVDFQNASYEEMQKIYAPAPKNKIRKFDLQIFALFFGITSLMCIAIQSEKSLTLNKTNTVVASKDVDGKISKVEVNAETIKAIDSLNANSAYKLTLAQNYRMVADIKKLVETDKNSLNKEQMSKAFNYLFSFQENALNNVYTKELAFSPEAQKVALHDSVVAKEILLEVLNQDVVKVSSTEKNNK